jgi:transposase InsO family protein
MAHANARLTVHGRLLLVQRVVHDKRPVAHVAKEMGISRQCAHRWVRRYRAEGEAGLHERNSRPRSCPQRTPACLERRVEAARRLLRTGRDGVAVVTGVPARTVSRILTRRGLPHLADCDPISGLPIRASRTTTLRYERDQPGELIHVDVKKIGRIPDGGGWRLHGRAATVEHRHKKQPLGYDYVHVAVDDHSRAAYAEILADERGATCAGFLLRAAAWFAQHGAPIREVMTDNAMNYVLSRDFTAALSAIGAKHRRIRPHCPWQNGKAERFNRTLQTEWAYRHPFASNTQRAAALDDWLEHYNTDRRHHALGGHPPASRLPVTNVVAQYT